MNELERIDLWQSRTAGEVISAAMMFLRVHSGTLGKSLLVIAGLPVLSVNLFIWYFLHDRVFMAGTSFFDVHLAVITGYCRLFITAAMMQAIISRYMVLYAERGNRPVSVGDLWASLRTSLPALLLYPFAATVMIGFMFFFLWLPGIYMTVPLSILLPVVMREDLKFFDAVSRGFQLVKHDWWLVFGSLFGAVALAVGLSFAVAIPEIVLGGSRRLLLETSEQAGWLTTAILVLRWLIGIATMVVPAMVASVQYFNLVEKQEGVGIIDRIATIGSLSERSRRNEVRSWS